MLHRTTMAIVLSAIASMTAVGIVSSAWPAVLLGGGVALGGAMLGLLLCHRVVVSGDETSSLRRTNKLMAAFVASMLIRMVVLAGSLAVILVLLGWDLLAFVAAFFLVHLLSQVLEIRYVHRAKRAPVAATV